MGFDDLYRFRSFGPAPPRKPYQRSWHDPEKLREARQKQAQQVRLAEALRQTPGPGSAQRSPGAHKKLKVVKSRPNRRFARDKKIDDLVWAGRELKLKEFCQYANKQKIPPLLEWLKADWPGSWMQAYQAKIDKKWIWRRKLTLYRGRVNSWIKNDR
jgi:hypothetical protein